MSEITIGCELSLDEIMQQHPNVISVFLKHKMMCIGCPIASFHSINDACREYDLNKAQFVKELNEA